MNDTTTGQKLFSRDQTLKVFLNETFVGALSLLPGDTSVFAFDEAYIENPERPILSLSFKSATGRLLTDVHPRRTRLDPFFSNLLPEGHMREYLALRAGVKKEREFLLLSALKDDLPGAIRLETNITEEQSADQLDVEESVRDDGPLRFSLAGIQLKFSAIREAKHGLTIPVSGAGGDWIVKLPSATFDALNESEFSMMTLAGIAGITVPPVMLVETQEIAGLPSDLTSAIGPSLAIERYDRRANGLRIHAEDFAQVFGLYPADKYGKASYENIAFVLWTETGEEGLQEFVRRLVFTVLIGNADMHVKNVSLIYPDGQHPKLSPAYDLVPTILFMPSDRKLGLSMGKTKNMQSINSDVLRKFAAGARVPEGLVLMTAKQTVSSILEAWSGHKANLPLSPRQIRAIEEHMESVPLTHELSGSNAPLKALNRTSSDASLQQSWFVHGDVQLDVTATPGKIVFKTDSGEKFETDAPSRMLPWIVGGQAANIAKRHPKFANTWINIFVGPELYDEWREENNIRFDWRSLESTVDPEDLEQQELTFNGKFFPTLWRRLQNANDEDSNNIFDIVFPDGDLWSWTGKVLSLGKSDTLPDGRKRASVTVSITDPKYVMRLAT